MKTQLLDEQDRERGAYQYPKNTNIQKDSLLSGSKEMISKQQEIDNANKFQQRWMEEAYEDFKERITKKYLISYDLSNFEQLKKSFGMIEGNSSPDGLMRLQCFAYGCLCLICPIAYYCTRTIFEVQANHFALVEEQTDKGRKTQIYGPGFHVTGYFNRLQGIYQFDNYYPNGIIQSDIGDLKIVKVVQGNIMHLDCGGNNIILGPGLHKITDPMTFIKIVNLNSFYIEIGPEKWITVPTGYDGISLNRGQIKVLEGGKLHHLAHIGDKFAKMVPKTLQTDRVPSDIPKYIEKLRKEKVLNDALGLDPSHYLETSTIEGASVHLDVMIFWRIVDTELAALTAMTFLQVEDYNPNQNGQKPPGHIQASSEDIADLRANVLRICKNHLCTLVGSCSLASKTSLQQAVKQKPMQNVYDKLQNEELFEDVKLSNKQNKPDEVQQQQLSNQNQNFQILNFLQNQCGSVKDHINEDIKRIGVLLDNICIFSVIPSKDIQAELDKQTKAKVDANTAVLQARSLQQSSAINQESQSLNRLNAARNEAEILRLKAQSEAEAEITRAGGQSQADIKRAEGQSEAIIKVAMARKKEAEELQSIQIAQDLAHIRVLGEAGEKIFKGDSNNFVFGNNPGDVMYSMFRGIQDKKQ